MTGTRSVEAQVFGHTAGREAAHGTPVSLPATSHAVPATPEAFDALYADAALRLTWQTYLLTADRRRAAHCVRRSFQLAWSDWPTVSADASPEGWLRAAAFDLALSPWHELVPHLRRALRLPHLPRPGAKKVSSPGAGAAADLPLPVQDRELLKAMARLPDAQRRALVLHDVVGLDWAQTAAEVEGTTPVTFGRVVRARRALAHSVPGIVGADPEEPGFGRGLGERLGQAARRACAHPVGHGPSGQGNGPGRGFAEWRVAGKGSAAPGRITRARARLHDRGVTLAAGALTLATAGFLGAGLVWGTPMHPVEQPVVPHPTRATLIGTAVNATTDEIQPPKVPAPPLTPFTTGPGLVQKSQSNSGDARKPDKSDDKKGGKNPGHRAPPHDSRGSGGSSGSGDSSGSGSSGGAGGSGSSGHSGSSGGSGSSGHSGSSHGSGATNAHLEHGHPHQPPAKKRH